MASSVTFAAAVVLLGITGWRVAAALGLRSATTFVVGAWAIAHVVLLLVALGLSLFRAFTPLPVLVCLAAVAVATALATRGARSAVQWRAAVGVLAADPLLIALAVAAFAGLAYTAALAFGVPQVEDDALTFHLVRAGLWRQHEGITYLDGIIDLRNNAYPPGGELGPFTAMTLAGKDTFVALDQLLAAPALALGVAGISRRLGLASQQAAFAGLLVLTLPVVALQAGTAMSDLVVAAFLVAAVLFLLDDGGFSPWLAGVCAALAADVKLSSPVGIPLLLAIAWLARPPTLRRPRLVAVVAGIVLGSFWYAVNLAETGTVDGHVSEEFQIDRGVAPVTARIARLGIEFVDLSGANGRDRWLYAVAAAVVLVVAAAVAVRTRRRAALVAGAVAAAVAVAPVVLLQIAHGLVRAYFKGWDVLGRPDLAAMDSGRDITRSASNFSWYGPLGSLLLVGAGVLAVLEVRRRRLDRLAVLFVLAPFYWLVAFSILFWYQEWAGRFFMFAFALAATTWGLVLRWRPLAWGVTAIAATTLLLTLLNDAKRPSGVPLLERDKPRSIWHEPRWAGPAIRPDYAGPIGFLDHHVPKGATVGLAITPSEPVYPFFGRDLDHRVVFVHESDRDAPAAQWVFVRPGQPKALCSDAWRTAETTSAGWRILRRTADRC